MQKIYAKSADGKTVGVFEIKPQGSAERAMQMLMREGWSQIGYQEFRRLKSRILLADHDTRREHVIDAGS